MQGVNDNDVPVNQGYSECAVTAARGTRGHANESK